MVPGGLSAGMVFSLACTPQTDRPTDSDGTVHTDDSDPAVDLPGLPGPADTDAPPPVEYVLRLPEGSPPEITLDLDRAEVEALFGPVAGDITLLTIDLFPLVAAALDEVKAACGTDWRRDIPNPTYDCSLTALGQTFSGPDGTWRSSPEFTLIRILTMTPANGEVDGSSVSLLATISDTLGIGGGFGQILADSLQIPRTTEFLGTEPLARAVVAHVADTHPAGNGNGTLSITLQDALEDLATVGPRFGPVAGHPGLVDPAFPTAGAVFTDDFRMVASLTSNLRVVEGLDLGRGKDWLSVVVDTTGPTYDDEVEFDFDDPARFRVEGIAAAPTMDMRFVLQEDPVFVPACTNTSGRDCRSNAPGAPVGTGFIWSRPTETIESVIAAAGRERYGALKTQRCYLGCLFDVRIGQDSDPPGFNRFSGLGALLAPPPQYVWEMLNEIAQLRLHDAGTVVLSEGDADVAFDLRDVPVGITGAEAAEAVRPVLQAQSGRVSDFLLGDFRKNNGRVDVYWQRTEDGRPTLFFIAPDDLADPRRYTWDTPGFFSDAALTNPVHRHTIAGVADTTHAKWQPNPGASHVHVRDDDGTTWRLDTWLEDASDPRAPLVVEVQRVVP